MNPEDNVLDGFSCKFEKGKSYSIVGPVGSGRSTLIQLVERFYDTDAGEVLVDGKNINSINLMNYRKQVGYVPIKPVLFGTTLK
jgi:ABC-type multidrug transport system fused ATPase/permease subunit